MPDVVDNNGGNEDNPGGLAEVVRLYRLVYYWQADDKHIEKLWTEGKINPHEMWEMWERPNLKEMSERAYAFMRMALVPWKVEKLVKLAEDIEAGKREVY